MSEKDQANILGILDAIDKINDYIGGVSSAVEYYNASVVFDATLMNFILIGEMVERLSDELKQTYPTVDWQKIKDFRNLVAHDYLGVDAEEVWQIIKKDLPPLKEELEGIVKRI